MTSKVFFADFKVAGKDQVEEIIHSARETIFEWAKRQDGQVSRAQTVEDYMNHYSKEALAYLI